MDARNPPILDLHGQLYFHYAMESVASMDPLGRWQHHDVPVAHGSYNAPIIQHHNHHDYSLECSSLAPSRTNHLRYAEHTRLRMLHSHVQSWHICRLLLSDLRIGRSGHSRFLGESRLNNQLR